MAEEVASKALAPLQKEIEDFKLRFTKYAHELAYAALPEQVHKTFLMYRDYFKISGSVLVQYLDSKGKEVQDWAYYYFPAKLVLPSTQGMLTISVEEYKALTGLGQKADRAQKHYNDSLNTLVVTLQQLSTVKRAKEEFPELVKYFPKEQVTALVLDTSKAKSILSQLK